ncbi:MAG: carbohydrate-binding domain-containing protein, partial [Fibrobacter sp.]|nr:carbohydrate-binding domain-containing protein [Fibrobacter sp.]
MLYPMKNIKIFAFLSIFLLSAAVSTAWAKDVTLTYKISVRGTIPHAYITNADGETVCDWRNGLGTLWPANEGHSMNDDYKITFRPNQELDKTGKNENNESASTTAFRTEENTIFTVSVGKKDFYIKSVTFKEDGTEKASSSDIAPNSTSIRVEVPENKFFNYITVVLTDDIYYSLSYDENLTVSPSPSMTYNNIPYYAAGQTVTFGFSGSGSVKYFVNGVRIEDNSVIVRQNLDVQIGVPYIDEKGERQIRKPGEYTVLTSLTDVSNLGGGWYVVQGEVEYTNQVKFSGDAHLILADGAEMEIVTEGESEHGIYASKNLTIYGQNGQSGILNDTANGTNGSGIYSYSGDITINGGTVTATGDYGIYSYNGVTINGGSVTATGTNGRGIYGKGDVTISGGTVRATGTSSGIYSYNGVTINGGSVTATSTNGIGIGIEGNITISGGTVRATSTNGHGIDSEGKITINGGSVTATSTNSRGIYSYNGVTISGGTVEASGSNYGIYSKGTVTINGGKVEATGYYGIDGYNGITLDWTNSTDFIKASSYYSGEGTVQIAEGKLFKDEDGNVYRGTLSSTQLDIIKKKTLEPCYAVTLNLQDGNDPVVVAATSDENGVAHVAKPADPIRSGFTFEGWFTATDGNTEFDFSAAITGNTT